MSYNTPGTANAYPKVGPIIINEIMYHPLDDGDAEYIEILNISDSSVTLYDSATSEPWKITDGIEYTFPSGPPLTLTPGEYFLIIKDLSAFTDEYDDPPICDYAVWTSGSLSNGGEKVEISMPGEVDESVRQYIRIDRINYDDEYPWPTDPDGTGTSLTRIAPANYGNDVANWQSATPTPGEF